MNPSTSTQITLMLATARQCCLRSSKRAFQPDALLSSIGISPASCQSSRLTWSNGMLPVRFTSLRTLSIRDQSMALGTSQFLQSKSWRVGSISFCYKYQGGKYVQSKLLQIFSHHEEILVLPQTINFFFGVRCTLQQPRTSWRTMALFGRMSARCLTSVDFPEHVAPLQNIIMTSRHII